MSKVGTRNTGAFLNGPCFVKVLVPGNIAGCIIGKSGSEIVRIEKASKCVIRLSNTECYFPGTMQRICAISGEIQNIQSAILTILQKIRDQGNSQGPGDAADDEAQSSFNSDNNSGSRISITLAVPKSAISGLIGRGGQSIRSLSDNSGSKIVISERENGLTERLVTLSGSLEAVKTAFFSILQDIQQDSNLRECCTQLEYSSGLSMGSSNLGSAYYAPYRAAAPTNIVGPGTLASAAAGGLQPVSSISGVGSTSSPYDGIPLSILSSMCEIGIQIPDTAVGAVIGRQGRNVTDIIKSTGARVHISPKGELIPGTKNRQVTISGALVDVHRAHCMLMYFYLSAITFSDGSDRGMSRLDDNLQEHTNLMRGMDAYCMTVGADGHHPMRHERSRYSGSSPYTIVHDRRLGSTGASADVYH